MRTAIWFALLAIQVAVCFAAYERGKVAEREDTRSYVNRSMADIGFCKWLKVSRMAEDCADRESRALKGASND